MATPFRWECRVLRFVLPVVVLLGLTHNSASAAEPATVKQAAQVINLETIPLVPDSPAPTSQTATQLSYQAKGDVLATYKFHQKQLLDSQWKELPGSYLTDQAAYGTFTRDGYVLSVTASPGGQPGLAFVNIINHGNVALDELPLPAGTQQLYAGPVSLMLTTDAPLGKTKSDLRDLLTQQGWLPYGEAGPQQFFKKNAVRLGVMVAPAPAQQGKTSITFTTDLMSAELPAPQVFEELHYAEVTRTIDFLTTLTAAEIDRFYRETLAPLGWQPTTDRPLQVSFRDTTIFRNPERDLLTLETHQVEGRLRGHLRFESAAQVAAMEERARAAIQARKQQAEKPAKKIAFAIPAGTEKSSVTAREIELQAKSGSAKAIVDRIRKSLEADGWKTKIVTELKEAGTFQFHREEQEISLIYVDPGFIPAEITLSALGFEFETAPAKK